MKNLLIGTAIAALTTGLAHAEAWKMSVDAPDGTYLTKNIRAVAEDVAPCQTVCWKSTLFRKRYC
ncbi:hypothetical protein [Sulfitobacter sp.]|uniref:hypothetical protein n=1 Tax=Sulfitobacter sp. TaxID=1903071 RepID=UPI003002C1A6